MYELTCCTKYTTASITVFATTTSLSHISSLATISFHGIHQRNDNTYLRKSRRNTNAPASVSRTRGERERRVDQRRSGARAGRVVKPVGKVHDQEKWYSQYCIVEV